MKTVLLLSASALTAFPAQVLRDNVTKWESKAVFDETTVGGFQSLGMTLNGEVGWHTHGTGSNKDVDIDLAFILET